MNISSKTFRQTINSYYKKYGRHSLPWRQTVDPYAILVSELMLQQTQVDRVMPKYDEFMRQFPTLTALAEAPLRTVLIVWQGLGYNRRAKYLHETAKILHTQGIGLPRTLEALQQLPGIGPYTAGALLAFAFNTAHPIIETNIRTVYLHFFFANRMNVTDAEILALVAMTLPKTNAREWYYALMDYGVFLKKNVKSVNHKSRHHHLQSTFAGSARQVRGQVIRALADKNYTQRALQRKLATVSATELETQLRNLHQEGLIAKQGTRYTLPI